MREGVARDGSALFFNHRLCYGPWGCFSQGSVLNKLSLNTFIKLCLLDTGGRIAEIQKRLSSDKGYDFYKPLQKAVRAFSNNSEPSAEEILAAPVNEIERAHNRKAFDSFKNKFGSIRTLDSFQNPKHLKFEAVEVEIAVDPFFELEKAGTREIYSLWPTRTPQLTQRYGAVACHIMRRSFANTQFSNANFFFADLVSNKVYSERQITNNTNLIFETDVSTLGKLFASQK